MSAAPYFRRGRTAGSGVQIDMLVQLPKSVYLMEVKRMNFIPVAVEQDVQRKIDRLPLKKGTSVRTVLVYRADPPLILGGRRFGRFLVECS